MRILIVVMTLLSACGLAASGDDAGEEAGRYSDSTKPMEVAAGKEFAIVLESNRTTGYEWQLAGPVDRNMVTFVSSEYLADKTDFAGSGGREIWTFRADLPGQENLSFKYARPWERNAEPAKRKTFVIVVKEDNDK